MDVNRFFKLIFCVFLTSFAFSVCAQSNKAYFAGEKLTYRVYYNSFITGNVTAGEAAFEVSESHLEHINKPVLKLHAEGKSKGAFNWFFKVHDTFTSYIDPEEQTPYLFVRRTKEGKYFKNEDSYFYHENNYVTNFSEKRTSKKTVQTPIHDSVFDFVSAIYYIRTMPLKYFGNDSAYKVDFFLDDTVYRSTVLYQGIENIKIKAGKFRCMRIVPMMIAGEVFDDAYPVTVWVTDDKNRIPILIEGKILVGKVKMELVGYENIRNNWDSRLK